MTEEQQLLKTAATEITALRQLNNQMSARLKMFDDCMMLFKNPVYGGGMSTSGLDVVYSIDRYLERATAKSESTDKQSEGKVNDLSEKHILS